MLRLVAPAIVLLASVVVSPAVAAGAVEQLYFVEHESERHATGVLDEGEGRAFSFRVDEPNLTRVDFLLTWKETKDPTGLSAPDKFSLSVNGPDGRADARGPSNDGTLHVRIPVAGVPNTETVPAGQAQARLRELASQEGDGEWVAHVRLTDVGNPTALAKLDTGNDFQLVVVMTTYEAVPSVLVPQVGTASEAHSISLAWVTALIGLTCLAGVVAAVLLRPLWSRLLPGGDNSPSAGPGQVDTPQRR